jgi:hypothetical protein
MDPEGEMDWAITLALSPNPSLLQDLSKLLKEKNVLLALVLFGTLDPTATIGTPAQRCQIQYHQEKYENHKFHVLSLSNVLSLFLSTDTFFLALSLA